MTPSSTYSIAACDLEAGQWGVATQSKFLAVGSVVPWAAPGVGAVATQAYANPRYGPDGLRPAARRARGRARSSSALTAADDGPRPPPARRRRRRAAAAPPTPASECMDWAGGVTGPCFAAQGNILVSAETVDALAATFVATQGEPLAERLIACLAAAQAAGGDRRGQQSAALARRRAQTAAMAGSRTCWSTCAPTTTRRRSSRARAAVPDPHGALRQDTGVRVARASTPSWRASCARRLGRLGYEGELATTFAEWAGTENLEERVDGIERIDPVVLEELRRR